MTITKYEDCEEDKYKTISFKSTLIGNLVNLTITNMIPIGDNTGVSCLLIFGGLYETI